MLQVELEGEILVEPLNILDWREVLLRKWAITQVKVQWQHYGPEEAVWEDEWVMKENFSSLFIKVEHWDDVPFWGGGDVISPVNVNIHFIATK